jgi:HAD superfamily hydrolase (TIGR01509 family)
VTSRDVTTVLFDLHTTLVDGGDADRWLSDALTCSGSTVPDPARADLVAWLDTIWEHAREHDPTSSRDLSPDVHRAVFEATIAAGRPDVGPALVDALYEVMTDQWWAYDDAVGTLRALKEAGVAIGLVSNLGVDVRHVLTREGLLTFLDTVVLSCELGAVKPDPRIFRAALDRLGADPARTVMVGDNVHDDGGAAALGIRTLVLPGPTTVGSRASTPSCAWSASRLPGTDDTCRNDEGRPLGPPCRWCARGELNPHALSGTRT